MKQIHLFLAFGIVALLFACSSAFAQEQNVDHLFVATKMETTMPEGGSSAERDSLLDIYHKQVTEKNPFILSQRVMRHFYGSNSHDVVVVAEYKSWADIDAADKKDTELFQKYWTDPAARRQFNRMLGKYFSGHSDEIYTELTKFRK